MALWGRGEGCDRQSTPGLRTASHFPRPVLAWTFCLLPRSPGRRGGRLSIPSHSWMTEVQGARGASCLERSLRPSEPAWCSATFSWNSHQPASSPGRRPVWTPHCPAPRPCIPPARLAPELPAFQASLVPLLPGDQRVRLLGALSVPSSFLRLKPLESVTIQEWREGKAPPSGKEGCAGVCRRVLVPGEAGAELDCEGPVLPLPTSPTGRPGYI